MTKQLIGRIALAALLGCPLLLTSCASGGLRSAQGAYRSGSISGATSGINSLASKEKEGARDSELVFVEQGNINATAGNAELAKTAYVHADHSIEKHLMASKIQLGNEAGAMLVNLNSLPYHTSPAERLMAASYLATALLQTGDITGARSAIKLAKNRQLQINEEFKRQIEKEQSSLRQAVQADPKMQIKLDEGKIEQQTTSLQAAVAQFHPYNDGLSVPYSEALAGAILGSGQNAEKQRANESFGIALKANPGASSLNKAINSSPNSTTHIFIEDGAAPELGSTRFDLPIYINGAITTLSAAFPVFQPTPLTGLLASVKSGGSEVKADVICDFDRIAGAEYHRKIPGTIARTMASSTLKAAAGIAGQLAAKQSGGQYADLIANGIGVASVIYNVASAQADQRIWSTLPKQVRYACVNTPSGGNVEVGGKSIKLPSSGSNLVIARVINGQVCVRAASLSSDGAKSIVSTGSATMQRSAKVEDAPAESVGKMKPIGSIQAPVTITDNANAKIKETKQVGSKANEGNLSTSGSTLSEVKKQPTATTSSEGNDINQRITKIKSLSTRAQFDTEELSIRNDTSLTASDRTKLLKLIWSEETQKLK